MTQNKFPDGWDDGRVRRVLAHYGEQTEDEALAEDEAGVESPETVMNVPRDLAPPELGSHCEALTRGWITNSQRGPVRYLPLDITRYNRFGIGCLETLISSDYGGSSGRVFSMRMIFVFAVAAGLAVTSFGQSLPSFEVASVKPASPKGGNIGLQTYPGGRITATQYMLFFSHPRRIRCRRISGRWRTALGYRGSLRHRG